MRKRSLAGCFVIALALVAGGCSGRLVHREGLDATAKVAVVSVVIQAPGAAREESGRKVLQSAADHAAAQVRSGLAGVRPWQVVDASNIDKGKAALSLGRPSEKELPALFPQEEERKRVQDKASAELALWQKQFIGAPGLPVIPRQALVAGSGQEAVDPAVRAALLDQAGTLCKTLKTDAVAFAQIGYLVSHPRENAFIVTDDRTDGMLALSATVVMVDKTGTVIVDMGARSVNAASPSRDMLPLYRGTGKEAVAEANIDLADPKKKVARAFSQLVDESVAELMAALARELK